MVDTVNAKTRSLVMSRVRSKDTNPEMTVRRLVHGAGYRYRLHVRILPGTPDLVFAGRRKVIFVHGCFWHRHKRCALARLPKSHLGFWLPKLEENRRRDMRNLARLRKMGWSVLTVWECELKNAKVLETRIRRFLDA